MKNLYSKGLATLLLVVCSSLVCANQFYDIVNVANNDTLIVRSGPGTEHKNLLELSSDTQFISSDSTKTPTKHWMPVVVAGTQGWLGRHYLTKSTPATFDNLQCFGTEPHWSLTLNNSVFNFDNTLSPRQQQFALSSVNPAVLYTNRWYLTAQHSDKALQISLNRNESCTDDMSDKVYRYELMVIDPDNQVFTGCCH